MISELFSFSTDAILGYVEAQQTREFNAKQSKQKINWKENQDLCFQTYAHKWREKYIHHGDQEQWW